MKNSILQTNNGHIGGNQIGNISGNYIEQQHIYIHTTEQEKPKKQSNNGWQIEPPEKIERVESADTFINILIGYHDALCPYRAGDMSPLQNELVDNFYAHIQDYAMYGLEDLTTEDMRTFRQEMREQFDVLLENGLVVCAVGQIEHYVYNNKKMPMRITHAAVKKLELSPIMLALLTFCSAESEADQDRCFNEILELKPDLDVSKEQLLEQLNETKEKLTLSINPTVKLDKDGKIQNKEEILNIFYDITINAQDKNPKMFINNFAKIEESNDLNEDYAKALGADKKRLKKMLDNREFLIQEIHLLTGLLNHKECLLFGRDIFDSETTALHILEFLCDDCINTHTAQPDIFTLSFYSNIDVPQENDIKIKTAIKDEYFLELLKEYLGRPNNLDFQDTPHEVRVTYYANLIKQYIRQGEHKLSIPQYFDTWSNKKWVSLS